MVLLFQQKAGFQHIKIYQHAICPCSKGKPTNKEGLYNTDPYILCVSFQKKRAHSLKEKTWSRIDSGALSGLPAVPECRY